MDVAVVQETMYRRINNLFILLQVISVSVVSLMKRLCKGYDG